MQDNYVALMLPCSINFTVSPVISLFLLLTTPLPTVFVAMQFFQSVKKTPKTVLKVLNKSIVKTLKKAKKLSPAAKFATLPKTKLATATNDDFIFDYELPLNKKQWINYRDDFYSKYEIKVGNPEEIQVEVATNDDVQTSDYNSTELEQQSFETIPSTSEEDIHETITEISPGVIQIKNDYVTIIVDQNKPRERPKSPSKDITVFRVTAVEEEEEEEEETESSRNNDIIAIDKTQIETTQETLAILENKDAITIEEKNKLDIPTIDKDFETVINDLINETTETFKEKKIELVDSHDGELEMSQQQSSPRKSSPSDEIPTGQKPKNPPLKSPLINFDMETIMAFANLEAQKKMDIENRYIIDELKDVCGTSIEALKEITIIKMEEYEFYKEECIEFGLPYDPLPENFIPNINLNALSIIEQVLETKMTFEELQGIAATLTKFNNDILSAIEAMTETVIGKKEDFIVEENNSGDDAQHSEINDNQINDEDIELNEVSHSLNNISQGKCKLNDTNNVVNGYSSVAALQALDNSITNVTSPLDFKEAGQENMLFEFKSSTSGLIQSQLTKFEVNDTAAEIVEPKKESKHLKCKDQIEWETSKVGQSPSYFGSVKEKARWFEDKMDIPTKRVVSNISTVDEKSKSIKSVSSGTTISKCSSRNIIIAKESLLSETC